MSETQLITPDRPDLEEPVVVRARRRENLVALAQHRESRHAIKYAIVGVANVTIDFALYALFISLGLWYVLAKTLSLIVATANGYTFNRRWTFRAGDYRHATLARYVAVQAAGLVLNLAILAGLIEGAGMGAVVAQLVAIPVVCTLTFLANRLWTFGEDL